MAMTSKSWSTISSISRLRTSVILTKNLADISDKGTDNKGGSEKDDGGKRNSYDLSALFTNFASDCNPSIPSMYDCRKNGHCLSTNNVVPNFDTLPNIPSGIFRSTIGEKLGTGAGKHCYYKCPEYFSYHHMTFYDMHLFLRACRKPCPKTGRKP